MPQQPENAPARRQRRRAQLLVVQAVELVENVPALTAQPAQQQVAFRGVRGHGHSLHVATDTSFGSLTDALPGLK